MIKKNSIMMPGVPLAGTTIITHALCLKPDIWHLFFDLQTISEGSFRPAQKGQESGRVCAECKEDSLIEVI